MNKKIIAIGCCLVALAAVAGYVLLQPEPAITSLKASVEGRTVPVVVSVPGSVKEVMATQGDRVSAGQALFRLDATTHEQSLAQERANLAAIAAMLPPQATVTSPTAPVEPEGKSLEAVREEEENAWKRMEKASAAHASASVRLALLQRRKASGAVVPQQTLAEAVEAEAHAKTILRDAKKQYEKASYARAKRELEERDTAGKGMASAALASRIATYQAQLSRVRLAEQHLAATLVTAPESGVVLFMGVKPGFAVETGDAAVTLLAGGGDSLWVSASFAAKAMPRLESGLPCTVTTASGMTIPGTVGAVLPSASGGKNAEASARIRLHPVQDAPLPAIGEAVTVTVQPVQ